MNAMAAEGSGHPVRAYALSGGIHVEIVESLPRRDFDDEVERVWLEECRTNPRLHDGAILSVASLDAQRGLIVCRRDSYKHLVGAQQGVRTGACMLGVKGVFIARDDSGIEHVLVGTRGPRTRMYPGAVEFAPCGGVRPPQDHGRRVLTFGDLCDELLNEAAEELGGVYADPRTLAGVPKRLLGVCEDDTACSVDIVIGMDVPRECITTSDVEESWEYSKTRWTRLDELREALSHTPGKYSPPTHAILQLLYPSPPAG